MNDFPKNGTQTINLGAKQQKGRITPACRGTLFVLGYAVIQTKPVSSPLVLKQMHLYLVAFHDEPKMGTDHKMYSTQSLILNEYKLKHCPGLYHKFNNKLIKEEGKNKLHYSMIIVYIQAYAMTFLVFASVVICLHLLSMSLFQNK